MFQRIMPFVLLVIMLCSNAILAQESLDDDLAALEAAANAVPTETKGGRMVEDRVMARSMIEYGRREKNPEVILLAVEILHKNPVTSVKGDADTKESLQKLIAEAVAMRPEDEMLKERAELATETLDENTRGLAGGPRSWTVTLAKKGDYYQLDPRLVYNAHEKAVVTAYSEDPNVMLGASVRRGDQTKEITRGVGRGKVSVEWNAGITTTGWDVRVYSLSENTEIQVKVETN